MRSDQVAAYLDRIGAAPGSSLADLQRQHLMSVPFENLDIHLGATITLDPDAFYAKVVKRRRGGFCYELNGLFAELLRALGHDVTLLAARTIGRDGLGPPYDHLALRVDGGLLMDVGFGRFALGPLRLDERASQTDAGGEFVVTETAEGDLDVAMDGEPQYRLELRPRELADFAATAWWHQTSPRSHFTQGTVCSLLTADGRVTIGGRLLVETVAGERRERTVDGDDELLALYRERFGVELERLPAGPQG
jgi:N-hydroxyarylamine O-acetyltransferase